jgi:hypothetical protein
MAPPASSARSVLSAGCTVRATSPVIAASRHHPHASPTQGYRTAPCPPVAKMHRHLSPQRVPAMLGASASQHRLGGRPMKCTVSSHQTVTITNTLHMTFEPL